MKPSMKKTLRIIAIVLAVLLFGGIAYSLGVAGSLQTTQLGAPASVESSREMAAEQSAGGMAYDTKDSLVAPPPSADGAADLASPSETLVIRNASMSIRVKQMDEAIDKVRSLVAAAKGEVTDMYRDEGPDGGPIPYESGTDGRYPSNATLTIRVPAEGLVALQRNLAGLGAVTAESASSSDVTEQHIDLAARLKNLQAQETQLRSFFEEATKVEDLLAVQQELSRVRGEIESMQAQMEYLERQAARATLTVTLTEPASVVSPAGTSWGVSEAITNGLRGAMALINGAITITIAVAPFAVIALILWFVIRMLRRRRARHTSADDALANEDA